MAHDAFATAFQLHVAGFTVVPSGAGNDGKHPLVKWAEFQTRPPSDADLEAWEHDYHPRLWGIVTNDDVAVIDADGEDTRFGLEAELGKPHVITPRGGGHWYIDTAGHALPTKAGVLRGVDIRGEGGFCNVVGSSAVGKYQILTLPNSENLIPWDKVPERILSALNHRRPAAEEGLIPEGQRNDTLARMAGSMRRAGMTESEINDALLSVNANRCQPPLPEDEVERIATSIARYDPNSRKTKMEPQPKEPETRETSFLDLEDRLYEQIVLDGEAAFAEYHTTTDESQTVTHTMLGDTKIVPISSEEITLGAVKLPSGIAEYGDTLTLLEEIEDHIYRYLDVSDSFRKFAAYYILLSWVYDRFNTLPYLRFIGDTGCGKSRALDACGGLCYKAISASGCITPAPIYRMLKKWAGTIILDEADLQNSDEYHEVTKILNCGFERNRPVIRAVRDNPERLQILPTFGPKVFATRRRFKDAALEARCLTEIMQETARDEIPATLTDTFYREQETLRNKLLLFRFSNYNSIDSRATLDLPMVEPRLKQISTCFASLFANHPEVLADYRAFIEHHQAELIEQRAATTIGRVVEALFSLIESTTVATVATLDTSEPILNVSAGDIATSVSMTAQGVGGILKTLGLQTRQRRIDGKVKRLVVYDKVKFDILKKRYIPSEGDVASVASVATTTDSMQKVATSFRCDRRGGFCSLRKGGETFSCVYQPEACPFFHDTESL